jgi:hypothetical protein
MTGTGRRRKPSSEEEEPRSADESSVAAPAPTVWSTYAPPPEPEYSYDWRRDGSIPESPAQPPVASPYPDLPPPGAGQGHPAQAPPSPAQGFPAQAPPPPSSQGFPSQAAPPIYRPNVPPPPFPSSPADSSGPSYFPPTQPGPSRYGGSQYPSSPAAPSAYPSAPPPVPPQYPSPPEYPSPPLPSYLQPPPPAHEQSAPTPTPAPARPDFQQSSAYLPPPAAKGIFAPRTFEQPAPYLPDEPLPGEYKPAGFQPTRYSPPDSGTTRRPAAQDRPSPPAPSDFDADGLFDADALFDPEPAGYPDPIAQASASPAAPPLAESSAALPKSAFSAVASPVEAQPGADPADRKPTKIGSSKSDFAFVEEETDEKEIAGWLTFVESRAESRAERARRMRRRLIAGGGALVLVVAGTLTYLWATGSSLLTSASPPPRDVVLLQISDNTSGDAVADAILAADPPTGGSGASGASAAAVGHGAAVLIPSQMSVTGIGSGSQPFSGDMTANPPVPPAGVNAISDSLGVQVNAVWSMDETTFAALIDLFGGVTVTTNTAVPAVGSAQPTSTPTSTSKATANPTSTPSSGPNPAPKVTTSAIPEGSQKLDGAQALAYALYQGKGDSIDTQVNRFGQVLSALLADLPTQEDLVNSYLNQLGIVPDPALPQAKLAAMLAQMAAEQQAGQFTVKSLPLQDNATDQLDFTAAGPIISSLLGGTVQSGLASGGTARVLIEDATGTTGNEDSLLQSAATAKLISAGYSYVGSAVVSKRTTSVIEIPTGADQSAAGEVAQTLGLPTGDVKVVSGMSEISDVTVIVGTDWIQTGLSGG